ncbi:MAG TPA: type VI secretion system tube protein Hcp [Solirubrobacterales bacterium]|nr:type VI secretion system tube protein Hcp [Solirubrobacterales bacterium]
MSIGGQTFTLGDGRTLTAPASPIPPLQAVSGGPSVATMTLGNGGGATSSGILAWQLVGGSKAARGIQIVKPLDKASPILQQSCANGKHIPKAVLHVRRSGAGGGPQTIILTNARVDSYGTEKGKGGTGTVTETVSLSFGSIKIEDAR